MIHGKDIGQKESLIVVQSVIAFLTLKANNSGIEHKQQADRIV